MPCYPSCSPPEPKRVRLEEPVSESQPPKQRKGKERKTDQSKGKRKQSNKLTQSGHKKKVPAETSELQRID